MLSYQVSVNDDQLCPLLPVRSPFWRWTNSTGFHQRRLPVGKSCDWQRRSVKAHLNLHRRFCSVNKWPLWCLKPLFHEPWVVWPYDLKHSSLMTSLLGGDSADARCTSSGPNGALSWSACSWPDWCLPFDVFQVKCQSWLFLFFCWCHYGCVTYRLNCFYNLVTCALAVVQEARVCNLSRIPPNTPPPPPHPKVFLNSNFIEVKFLLWFYRLYLK